MTWARLTSSPLSTFPQPCSSTASQRLTSLFAENIHRPIHRTLALHPPGAGVIGACSHAGPGLACKVNPYLPSLPSGQQPAHARRLSDEVSDNRHGQRQTVSGHPRTVCRRPCVLRRWQPAPRLAFGTKRPTGQSAVLCLGPAAAPKLHRGPPRSPAVRFIAVVPRCVAESSLTGSRRRLRRLRRRGADASARPLALGGPGRARFGPTLTGRRSPRLFHAHRSCSPVASSPAT